MSPNGERFRVLVTGGNRGLGLGLVKAYVDRGADVLAVCRQHSEQLSAWGVEVIGGIDMANDSLVERFRHQIGTRQIDVLVCNAGINLDGPRFDDIDLDNLAQVLNVNALGCVRTVIAALPSMTAGSKIVLMGSMGLLPLGILRNRPLSNYGYRMSKSALVSFGMALGYELRERMIAVAIASPGAVDTDMLRTVSARSGVPTSALEGIPDIYEAARRLCDRIDRLTLDESPALDRDPSGAAAISDELLALLRNANAEQLHLVDSAAAVRS